MGSDADSDETGQAFQGLRHSRCTAW
jgi:hypothetical protein